MRGVATDGRTATSNLGRTNYDTSLNNQSREGNGRL